MAKKDDKRKPPRNLPKTMLAQAMRQRIFERISARGTLKLPAVPSLLDDYVKLCASVFSATGRTFHPQEHELAEARIRDKLSRAFATSSRSKIEIQFDAEPGRPLSYVAEQDVTSVAELYERWMARSDGPLFGALPDSMVTTWAETCEAPQQAKVLDFGAGTGRNALWLARRGHPVTAVEITPKFAARLEEEKARERLPIAVISEDVFQNSANLDRAYRLVLASEVVPDFRSVTELRKLFLLAAEVLEEGGLLLFNVHLCAPGYNPEKAARELGQQCYSCPFTPGEVAEAAQGLPFVLRSNESAYHFEKSHLPADAWPPTPWYENWSLGLDLYDIDPSQCPLELRWLAFEKRVAIDHAPLGQAIALGTKTTGRARRFDPRALRAALSRRLARRLSAAGTLTLPALPALLDIYQTVGVALFRALGRSPNETQQARFREDLSKVLDAAFSASPRSEIIFEFSSGIGAEIKYQLTEAPVPLRDAYELWHENLGDALFGSFPDARLVTLLASLSSPRKQSALDLGAGLGRNAFYLAEQGYAVDAVELVPTFAAQITEEATRRHYPITVFDQDLFACEAIQQRTYGLILAAGLAGDFRSKAELSALFVLAAQVLCEGGLMLLNLHVSNDGVTLERDIVEWGQQCCSAVVSTEDLVDATQGLPLDLVSEDNAFEYEKAHLSAEHWPPTPTFYESSTGQHMFALEPQNCPIQLKWLLYRKRTKDTTL